MKHNLKKNQVLEVPVLSIKKENRRSYYVCDLGDGEKAEISMFPFQRREEMPETIEVFVRDVKETGPILSQNTATLFRRFYDEGGVYTFRIEDFVHAYPSSYYIVVDRNGLTARLSEYGENITLAPKQYVSCRVEAITSSRVRLSLVENTEEKANQLISFRPLTGLGSQKGWLEMANEQLPEEERITEGQKAFARWSLRYSIGGFIPMDNCVDAYLQERGEWVIELITILDSHMKEWIRTLLKMNDGESRFKNRNLCGSLISAYRKLCVYLLEDSDEISAIADEEIRAGYQNMLAHAEQRASEYEAAVMLLMGDKENAGLDYAQSVLHKIEKSGYLLQPEKRLKTLRCLFQLQPEIMDAVMPQFLWSVIGSKGVWEREPFHSLVFGLLQSYVSYNARIIDSQGYDEEDLEGNRLNLVIRTLAIMLLLAQPYDDVRRHYYRAMLYRFASYVPMADCETLLEKSFRCLTESDYLPLEFGWTIIQMLNPATIVTLLSSPIEGKAGGYKIFKGKKAQLEIVGGSMLISTYESELKQRKQLSSEMMKWHDVQIMASGKPDGTIKPSAKEEDLIKYQAWWNYLDNCIYLFKSTATQSKMRKEEEEDIFDEDDLLDRRCLLELARVIDRYAMLQDRLTDTYNYLSLATLMAKLADERWMLDNFDARRRLLVSLYKFSHKESTSVETTLKEFGEIDIMVNTDRYTRKLVQQVRIVTCIGNTAQNPLLWSLYQDAVDEEVQQLAQMAIAYNMYEGIGLDNGERDTLIEKINGTLGIQITVPKTIVVGEEGKNLEFKTSIVYPPSKTGQRRVALAEQTHEILKNICGFLNAEGGTLMLGVNDYGRICGVEEDLSHKEFAGNKDKYCRYIQDNIRSEMGDMAESLVTTTILDMGGHFVLALRVRPSEKPVLLRDNLWQRNGAETLNRLGEVRSQIMRTRSQVYAMLDDAHKFGTDWRIDVSIEKNKDAKENIVEKTPAVSPSVKQAVPVNETLTQTFERISKDYKREYLINTSELRLKKIDSGDVYPAYYLYLTDGEYYRAEDDYGKDDEQTMLTIPVFTDDYEEDAWLVLVYEDATVIRVPMSEINGRSEWQRFKRYNEKKLFFAGIGGAHDCLVTVFKGNTTPQYRCDDVTSFEEGGMQDEGEPLVTCKYQAILYCEIVSCLAVTGMRPGMYNPVKTTLGFTVQAAGGDPERRTLVRAGIKTDF